MLIPFGLFAITIAQIPNRIPEAVRMPFKYSPSTLLQDRNIIVITEIGFPITLINIAVAIKLNISLIPLTFLAGPMFMGVVEWFRQHNKTKIVDKRNEINAFIRKLEKEIRKSIEK
jgi:hypothetical protein